MRGDATEQGTMLTLVTPDTLVPADHPIRAIKPIVDRALTELSPVFSGMYAKVGRPSIPPERLLKGLLLIALYSIRSERQFCERLQYDMLFKWFLDLNLGDLAFDASTFSKNKARLLEHEVSRRFFVAVREEARRRQLLSAEHFTVDGTLLDAWASLKSLRPCDDEGDRPAGGGKNRTIDYKGQRRTNQTHRSATDPEARLARKADGQPARLSLGGHVLMENRHGLAVDVLITGWDGKAERAAALAMIDRQPRPGRITLGADKSYDTLDFVTDCRARGVTPHVAQHTNRRRSRIDRRVTQHPGYAESQRKRKRVEEIFGWWKTIGGGRKLRYIGTVRNQLWADITTAAYNLIRIAKLTTTLAAT